MDQSGSYVQMSPNRRQSGLFSRVFRAGAEGNLGNDGLENLIQHLRIETMRPRPEFPSFSSRSSAVTHRNPHTTLT